MAFDLSIIIPVYNVSNYIEECLRPLSNIQDLTFEVIVVNDGTKDNSIEIAEPILKQLPHYKIINQENRGLSAARNSGMKEARGKYLFFYDSDDFINAEVFNQFIKEALLSSVDIACGQGSIFKSSGTKKIKKDTIRRTLDITDGISYFNMVLRANEYSAIVCINLYKRDFLNSNSIFFTEKIIHEDEEFSVKCLAKAKNVKYFPFDFYNYRFREGSVTKSVGHKYNNQNGINSFIQIISNIEAIAFATNVKKERDFYYQSLSRFYVEILRRIQFQKSTFEEQEIEWKKIITKKKYHALPFKYRFKCLRLKTKSYFNAFFIKNLES